MLPLFWPTIVAAGWTWSTWWNYTDPRVCAVRQHLLGVSGGFGVECDGVTAVVRRSVSRITGLIFGGVLPTVMFCVALIRLLAVAHR